MATALRRSLARTLQWTLQYPSIGTTLNAYIVALAAAFPLALFRLLRCRHKLHPPIGPFMQECIEKYFKDKGEVCNVKYIDPSYMIR